MRAWGRSTSRRFPGALAPFTFAQEVWADEKGRAEFLGGLGTDIGVSVMGGYSANAESPRTTRVSANAATAGFAAESAVPRPPRLGGVWALGPWPLFDWRSRPLPHHSSCPRASSVLGRPPANIRLLPNDLLERVHHVLRTLCCTARPHLPKTRLTRRLDLGLGESLLLVVSHRRRLSWQR